jgi:hypothetical protein
MKQGVVKGLSIGYQTVKEGIDELSGARQLKEVALWEVSAVVFPALSVAQVTDVKAESVDDDEPITLEPLVVPDLAPTPEPISEPVTDHSLDYAEVVREFRKSIERGTNA